MLHTCSQRRRRETTAAFLRSFKEALIGDWEHLRERLHLETIRERETHTQAPTAANLGSFSGRLNGILASLTCVVSLRLVPPTREAWRDCWS